MGYFLFQSFSGLLEVAALVWPLLVSLLFSMWISYIQTSAALYDPVIIHKKGHMQPGLMLFNFL